MGVKADDLIDKLIEKALEEVESRHPDEPPEERRQVATQIAIGALRYFMLKFTRNSVIAFDLQEALELRRRDRTLRAVRGRAGAEYSEEAGGARRRRCPISHAN